jgi:hypothetical protein
LTTQLITKQKQCNTFTKQKKTAQAKKCRTQLTTLNNTKIAQQKILSNLAITLSKLVAKPIVPTVPVPVIPVQPTPSTECCADANASNYDITCVAPRNPNQALCIYTVPPINAQVFGCTNPGAQNYNVYAIVDDGSCSFAPEIRE